MPLRIETFIGSITDPKLGAHAIVNAGNSHLALGSGVSGAIRVACGGEAFQEEVRAALEEQVGRPLAANECVVTGPGTCTAFRWVLHVASVDYTHPDPETGGASGPSRVRAATSALLDHAARLARMHDLEGAMIVGVPLLAAGFGGLSEPESAAAMIDAITAAATGVQHALHAVRFAVLGESSAAVVVRAAEALGRG